MSKRRKSRTVRIGGKTGSSSGSLKTAVRNFAIDIPDVNKQMTMVFSEDVWQKINYWVDIAPNEISGLGCARQREKGNFYVYDAFLIKQTNTSSFTDIDDDALANLLFELSKLDDEDKGTRIKDLTFWWHSHVDMAVRWSSQDDYNIATKLFGEAQDPTGNILSPWLLSAVFNKKGEVNTRLDIARPWITLNKMSHRVEQKVPQALKDFCKKEYDEKVTNSPKSSWKWQDDDNDLYPYGDCDLRRTRPRLLLPAMNKTAAFLKVPDPQKNIHKTTSPKEAVKMYKEHIDRAIEAAIAVRESASEEEKILPSDVKPIGFLFGFSSRAIRENRVFDVNLYGRLPAMPDVASSLMEEAFILLVNIKDPGGPVDLVKCLSIYSSLSKHDKKPASISYKESQKGETKLISSKDDQFLEVRICLTGYASISSTSNTIGVIFPLPEKLTTRITTREDVTGELNKSKNKNKSKKRGLSPKLMQELYKEIEAEYEQNNPPLSKELDWLVENHEAKIDTALLFTAYSQNPTEIANDFEVIAFDIEEMMEEFPGKKKLKLRDYYKLALLLGERQAFKEFEEELGEEIEITEISETNPELRGEIRSYCQHAGDKAIAKRLPRMITIATEQLSTEDLIDILEQLASSVTSILGNTEIESGKATVTEREELIDSLVIYGELDPTETLTTLICSIPDMEYCSQCFEIQKPDASVCPNCKRVFAGPSLEEEQTELAVI